MNAFNVAAPTERHAIVHSHNATEPGGASPAWLQIEQDSFDRVPHCFNKALIELNVSKSARLLMHTLVGASWGYRHENGGLIIRKPRQWLLDSAGLSRRSYQDAARELETCGLIKRTQTRNPYNPFRQGYTQIEIVVSDSLARHTRARTTSDQGGHNNDQPTYQQARVIDAAQTKKAMVDRSMEDQPAPERTSDDTSVSSPSHVVAQAAESPTRVTGDNAADETTSLLSGKDIGKKVRRGSGDCAACWLLSSLDVRRAVVRVYREWASHQQGATREDLETSLRCAIAKAIQSDSDAGGSAYDAAQHFSKALTQAQEPAGVKRSATNSRPTQKVSVPAATAQMVRRRVGRALPWDGLNDRGEQVVAEVCWSIVAGCFAASQQPLVKSINSAVKLVRSGVWNTPYGFNAGATSHTEDGGMTFLLGADT